MAHLLKSLISETNKGFTLEEDLTSKNDNIETLTIYSLPALRESKDLKIDINGVLSLRRIGSKNDFQRKTLHGRCSTSGPSEPSTLRQINSEVHLDFQTNLGSTNVDDSN